MKLDRALRPLQRTVLKRDRFLCQPCLRAGTRTVTHGLHHRIPAAFGGTDEVGNLQTTCVPCRRLLQDAARFASWAVPCPHYLPVTVRPVTVGPDSTGASRFDLVLRLPDLAWRVTGHRPTDLDTRMQQFILRYRNDTLHRYMRGWLTYPQAWVVTDITAQERQYWLDKGCQVQP